MDWVPLKAIRNEIFPDLTMRCDNAILPTINLLQEQNVRRYGFGPVENVAYGVNVGDFTLQFIVDKEASIIDFFESWMNLIVNRDSFGGANMNNVIGDNKRPYEVAYKDTYACPSVNVFVYDRAQNTVLEYNIYDVFPTGIQSMNLSWSEENSLMKLNVTFSFTDLRIRSKQSNFDNETAVSWAEMLNTAPIAVTTMGDQPLVDAASIVASIPADLANQPLVIGEGNNGVPRSFGVPGDTGPITATTPDVPTATIRDAFGQENIIAYVKEEKLLLISQQGGEDTEVIRAIKQILRLCVQDEDFNVDDLTTFDLEYLFLKLRARSVNNIVKLSYRDNEDGKIYNFELDLDTIEVEIPTDIDATIEVADGISMIMKYPSASITDRIQQFDNEVDLMTFFIVNCIDTIMTLEEIFPASDYSSAELEEFLDQLPVTSFEKIREFFEKMPKLYHKIEYTNAEGNDRSIELNNLKDFFMWR